MRKLIQPLFFWKSVEHEIYEIKKLAAFICAFFLQNSNLLVWLIMYLYAFLMLNHFHKCSLSLDALLSSHIQHWNYIAADIGWEMVCFRLMPELNPIHEYTSYFQFKSENKETNKPVLHSCYHTIFILQNIENILFPFRSLYQQMTKTDEWRNVTEQISDKVR